MPSTKKRTELSDECLIEKTKIHMNESHKDLCFYAETASVSNLLVLETKRQIRILKHILATEPKTVLNTYFRTYSNIFIYECYST